MSMENIKGLQFLEEEEIEECHCQIRENFAFISYAHDDIDAKIVRCVFKKLYDQGWNLWIDIANIPHDGNSWRDCACKVLINKESKCRMALFFRSEESLIRENIRDELNIIKKTPLIGGRIITIDIFHDYKDVDEYETALISKGEENKYKWLQEICKKVNQDSSAIRLRESAENDIDKLVYKISKELKEAGIYRRQEDKPAVAVTETLESPKAVAVNAVHTIGSSAELKTLLESDACQDENLKKRIKDKTLQIRISASDITFREEYTKCDVWLFSFDKSEPDADKWDFYILKKGDMSADASDRTCFDATDLKISVPIKNSIRKKHLENARKVHLTELLSGKWTECFKEK